MPREKALIGDRGEMLYFVTGMDARPSNEVSNLIE